MADQFEPSIYDRFRNQIRLFIRDADPSVLQWQIHVTNRLEPAIGSAPKQVLATLLAKRTLVSPELARSGLGYSAPSAFPKGATVFHFDPDEFGPAVHADFPTDDQPMYMTISPVRATGAGTEGPAVIIPPASFYSGLLPVWTEYFQPETVASLPVIGGLPPADTPVFRLPKGTTRAQIQNLASPGAAQVYVSFGRDRPFARINGGDTLDAPGGVTHVYITSDTVSTPVSAVFTINNYG